MLRARAALTLVLVGAAGCAPDIRPLGPTPAGEGIIIYMHADFGGPSQAINLDVADLGRVEGACSGGGEGETPTWRDCVSSVKVMPGWTATLYQKTNYRGETVTLTSDAPNLLFRRGPCHNDTFNDCAESIRVVRQ